MDAAQSPKYVQVLQSLTRRLAGREWKPGVALPSEISLAQEYGVSLGTMRKAIDQLAAQNVLVREQGKGTFVATHSADRALRHYFRIVPDDGEPGLPGCRVVSRAAGVASAEEMERLQLRAGASVLRFLRVRGFADPPIISERLVLPVSRFPGIRGKPIVDLPSLLYEYYSEQYGVIVTEAVEKLRAVAADATDVRLLRVAAQQPLLEIDRVALDISRLPVEWRLTHCDTRHHHYLNRFG